MKGCPPLSPAELRRALSQLNGRHGLRNRALVVLGVRSGLRVSELLSLKVGQVWDGRNSVNRFYVSRQATKGRHAGASIVVHPDAASVLEKWVREAGLTGQPGAWLFPSQKSTDGPLDRAGPAAGFSGRRRFGNGGHARLHLQKTCAAGV